LSGVIYATVKYVHLAAVAASFTLFRLRGVALTLFAYGFRPFFLAALTWVKTPALAPVNMGA
jgi:hypothetical protein